MTAWVLLFLPLDADGPPHPIQSYATYAACEDVRDDAIIHQLDAEDELECVEQPR